MRHQKDCHPRAHARHRPGFIEFPKFNMFNLEPPAGQMPVSTAWATHPTQMVRTHAQEAEACRAAPGITKLTGPNDSLLCSSQPNMMRLIVPSSATPGAQRKPRAQRNPRSKQPRSRHNSLEYTGTLRCASTLMGLRLVSCLASRLRRICFLLITCSWNFAKVRAQVGCLQHQFVMAKPEGLLSESLRRQLKQG